MAEFYLIHVQKWELKRWSQIDNILFRYSYDTAAILNSDITLRCQSLASEVDYLSVDANNEDCCTFLAEQFQLMCTAANGRRHSIDIINSFSNFHKSPACYEEQMKIFCLPRIEPLRDMSLNKHIDSGNVCQNYLNSRAGRLKSNELMVNIQLGEIHLNLKVV